SESGMAMARLPEVRNAPGLNPAKAAGGGLAFRCELGMGTASLAGSPQGINAISPSVPPPGMEMRAKGPGTDVHTPSYALTGRPESGEWRWVPQNYGGKLNEVIPER